MFEGDSMDQRDGFETLEFTIDSICYDCYNDYLVIATRPLKNSMGGWRELYAIKDGNAKYLYNAPLEGDDLSGKISAILSTGEYVLYGNYIWDPTSDAVTELSLERDSYSKSSYVYNAVETDDGVLFATTENGLRLYNFKDVKYVEPSSSHCGFYKNLTALYHDGEFIMLKNNKEIAYIKSDDYDLKDRKTLDPEQKLLLLKDKSIVFYDNSAKAFRIITENN